MRSLNRSSQLTSSSYSSDTTWDLTYNMTWHYHFTRPAPALAGMFQHVIIIVALINQSHLAPQTTWPAQVSRASSALCSASLVRQRRPGEHHACILDATQLPFWKIPVDDKGRAAHKLLNNNNKQRAGPITNRSSPANKIFYKWPTTPGWHLANATMFLWQIGADVSGRQLDGGMKQRDKSL